MNLQLSGNVTTMRDNRIHRDTQVISNFLILHTLHNSDNDVSLSIAQQFILLLTALKHHRRDILCYVLLFHLQFQTTNGWREDMILHLCMMVKPFFIIINVVKRRCQHIVTMAIRRQVLDNHQLQFS